MFLVFYAWSTKVGWVLQRVELVENEVKSWILFMSSKVNTKENMENYTFPFLCFDFGRPWRIFYTEIIKSHSFYCLQSGIPEWQLGQVYFRSGRQNPQLAKCCVQCTTCSWNNCKQWKRSRALKPQQLQANNLKYKCVWVLQVGICFFGVFCFSLFWGFLVVFVFCFECEFNWTIEIFSGNLKL